MPRYVHEFCITIPSFVGAKRDVQQFIEINFGEDIEQYCIARQGAESCSNEICLYVKTTAESEISEDTITTAIEVFADKECDVEACKSRKSWLKSITKVDDDPILKNVCADDLALYTRFHQVYSMSATDECGAASVAQPPCVDDLFSSISFAKDVDWTRNLFKWFTGGYANTNRYAAYVFGSGGEGKTRIVRALVQGKNVFECRLTEPYAFDGFESNTDILLVEDVNWDCFDVALRSTLLSVMARQPAVIQRKHKPQSAVTNEKVLTIFTSNFKLPVDPAFRRRCYVVWATTKACKDVIADNEDDPGDDDTQYVNPKPCGGAAQAKFKLKR